MITNVQLEEHFKEWLGWKTTLEMAGEVAYAYGDLVNYTEADQLDPKDSTLGRILWAAYNAGCLGMAAHLGVDISDSHSS